MSINCRECIHGINNGTYCNALDHYTIPDTPICEGLEYEPVTINNNNSRDSQGCNDSAANEEV